MKKTSILAALALVTTIGGVYATWNYAGTKVDTVTHDKGIVITDATTTTKHGIVHVHADTLTLSIDDIGEYTPGWNPTINNVNGGKLWIDFVPNAGAPDAITFKYTITITGNTYIDDDGSEERIFSELNGQAATGGTGVIVAETTKTLDLTQAADSAECSGAYTINTWSVEQVMGLLKVNDAYTLDTLEEYNEFKENLKDVKIIVTVTDVTGVTA